MGEKDQDFEPQIKIPINKEPKKEKKKTYSFGKSEKTDQLRKNLEILSDKVYLKTKNIIAIFKKNPHYLYIIILFFIVFFMIHQYSISNNVNYKGDLLTLIDTSETNTQTINELKTSTTTELDTLSGSLSTLSNQILAQKSITESKLTTCNNDLSAKNQELASCNTEKELKTTDLSSCQTTLEEKENTINKIDYIIEKYNLNDINEVDTELERLYAIEVIYQKIPEPIKEAYK